MLRYKTNLHGNLEFRTRLLARGVGKADQDSYEGSTAVIAVVGPFWHPNNWLTLSYYKHDDPLVELSAQKA